MNRGTFRLRLLGVFLVTGFSSSTFAQLELGEPPVNDLCANAVDLGALPVTSLESSIGALTDIDVPCGVDSGPFHNVWYSVIGTGGTLTATVCSIDTTIDDTKISVFCGDCDGLVCVTGNDDDCDIGINEFLSTVTWCSAIGQVYIITVGGVDSATATGAFEISVTDAEDSCGDPVDCVIEPPDNDDCTDAELVTLDVSVVGNNAGATADPVPFCDTDPAGHGVWYKIVGNGNELTASTCGAGTDFDTKIMVFCDCDTFTCVGGNDDFCDLKSEVTWCSDSGTTYYVLVGGFDDSTFGNYEFVVNDSGSSCMDPPPCAPPPATGACCLDGACIGTISETDCDTAGGDWFAGEDCSDFICFGACCDEATGICTENVNPVDCAGVSQTYYDHESCADISPPCTPPPTGEIPTVSEWGLMLMTLLGLAVGAALFNRQRARNA